MVHEFIDKKRAEVERLCMIYDVKTMYFFGSVCSNHFHEKSDVDILISFKDISVEQYTNNYFALHGELKKLFQRKIDLVTEASISNPFLRESIEETRELLYAA